MNLLTVFVELPVLWAAPPDGARVAASYSVATRDVQVIEVASDTPDNCLVVTPRRVLRVALSPSAMQERLRAAELDALAATTQQIVAVIQSLR